MPRLLALEWNDTEARFAVAHARGDQVVIEQAFSVSMRSDRPGAEQAPGDAGKLIAAALASRGIRHIDTLVAIGRSSIELRQLSVPPVPDEELADVVHFTALREFNALEEDWPLDFLPIDDAPDQPRTVLAAAVSPELVDQIQRTCQTAGLKPRRLILRPCAAASLYCRHQVDGRPRVRLLVDLLAEEADLTVIVDRKVIFLRTARLPGDPLVEAEAAQELLSEIRRTAAAVMNQLAGRKVEAIVLCGTGQQHAALAELIDSRLGTPSELFDPYAGLQLAAELQGSLPDNPGRFAPLLGMLLDELHQAAHAVDFLHPRHRPEAPTRWKTYVGAAAAVLLVLAGLSGYVWYECGRLDRQRVQLDSDLADLEKQLAGTGNVQKVVREVQAWKSHDFVWLDELGWLAERLPNAKEAMLTELQAGTSARGGEIAVKVLSDSSKTMTKLGQNVREKGRQVVIKDSGASTSQPSYPWHFTGSIPIPPESRR